MWRFSEKKSMLLLLAALASMLPATALAINGMLLTGYGTESIFMGGADVAVSRDAFAAISNPSGMTQLAGQALDIEVIPTYDLKVTHTDAFNDHKERSNRFITVSNGAYARRFEHSAFAAGVGLVVQGGIGWVYSGLNTNPALGGQRDDAAAMFAVIKMALAWEVNDQLSLGVALGVNYFAGSQELFPNTAANPSPALPSGFNGFRFKGAGGIGLNSKWGLQYRPAKDVTIGVTYSTQTSIPMKNGYLRMNFSNLGLGVVRYDNAKLEGFRLPEELAVGIAFRPAPALLVSLQDKWYNWSDAINALQLVATNPRTAGAPSKIVIPSTAGFIDQHVIEMGVAYDYDENNTLMAGFNYGRQPIPSQNVNPIFAPIVARHYMAGIVHKINPEWQIAGGVEMYMPQQATYDSPLFGANARDYIYTEIFHFSVGRRW
jgi:long-chain fatty acid transport protein